MVFRFLLLLVGLSLACSGPEESISTGSVGAKKKQPAPSMDAGVTVFPAYTAEGEYGVFALGAWEIHMNQAVIANPTLALNVVNKLTSDFEIIEAKVPASIVASLNAVHIYVDLNSTLVPGGAYHPSAQWLASNGYPTEWAKHVQLGNAANYLAWTEHQPAMLLHELAHAWHDQHWGANDAFIQNAFDSAMSNHLYDAVGYYDGSSKPAYAKTNHREYFAELSEAWFWTNDFYPFIRAELQAADPTGASAIETAWTP